MPTSLYATFDGEVLRPEEPLRLAPNTRVRLVLEGVEAEAPPQPVSFLRTARTLNLQGPPDWSARLEAYLYGESSRGE